MSPNRRIAEVLRRLTALLLTPAPDGAVPAELRRADGTSKLRFRGSAIYTTRELLEA